MPQLLAISGTLDIEAAQAEGQLPRFRMIAATGQPMRLEGWRQPVVVDFAGLNVPSQSLPIRYNHDAAQGVGHTDRIAIEGSNLVAEGVVDVSCEPEVSLWDLAAPQVIVEEAGGTFTDLGGVRTAAGGDALATNGPLHEQALAIVRR